jgi:hypothetical protein
MEKFQKMLASYEQQSSQNTQQIMKNIERVATEIPKRVEKETKTIIINKSPKKQEKKQQPIKQQFVEPKPIQVVSRKPEPEPVPITVQPKPQIVIPQQVPKIEPKVEPKPEPIPEPKQIPVVPKRVQIEEPQPIIVKAKEPEPEEQIEEVQLEEEEEAPVIPPLKLPDEDVIVHNDDKHYHLTELGRKIYDEMDVEQFIAAYNPQSSARIMPDKEYIISKFDHTEEHIEEQRKEILEELRYELVERWGVESNQLSEQDFNEKMRELESQRLVLFAQNEERKGAHAKLSQYISGVMLEYYKSEKIVSPTDEKHDSPTVPVVQLHANLKKANSIQEIQQQQKEESEHSEETSDSEFDEEPQQPVAPISLKLRSQGTPTATKSVTPTIIPKKQETPKKQEPVKKPESAVRGFDESTYDESTAEANKKSDDSDEISEIEQPKPTKLELKVQEQKRVGAQLMKEAILKRAEQEQAKKLQMQEEEEESWDDEEEYKEPQQVGGPRVDQSLDQLSELKPKPVDEDEESDLSEIPMAKAVLPKEEKVTLDEDSDSDIPMPITPKAEVKKPVVVPAVADSFDLPSDLSDIPMAAPVNTKTETKEVPSTTAELDAKFKELMDDVEASKQKPKVVTPAPPKRNLLKRNTDEDDILKGLQAIDYDDEESSL